EEEWVRGFLKIPAKEEGIVLKEARAILYNGLKGGATTPEIMFQLDGFFKEYIGTTAIEIKTGRELTPWHLENVVRTNFSDAYNEGRWAMMNDPDVGDFVPAVAYSSVMDERTTEICERLDGQVFEKGDPDLARIKPPNHYECRGTIVPVTKYEKYTPISREKKAGIMAIKPKNFIDIEGFEGLEDYEYLLHHIEIDDKGKEKIHHCLVYDHIANMFEQDHLLTKDGKVVLINQYSDNLL
ncbi:unnamed protein product, partial [marine sediment metagenome]